MSAHAGKPDKEIAASIMRALLASPLFLYRSELGEPVADKPGMRRLEGYEAASLLSFTLWHSLPDAELLRAAGAGELDTLAGLRKQAGRMANDPRLSRFYTHLTLQLVDGSHIASMPSVMEEPQGAAIAGAYLAEIQGHVKSVLDDTKPTFETYMTKSTLEGSPNGASYRKLPAAAEGSVQLPENLEAGVFALGAFSLAGSKGTLPSPVKRGKVVAEKFLCTTLPPPPDGLDTDIVPTSSSGGAPQTNRERYESATNAAPPCSTCHSRFNDLGYAFENFDHLGRYRTKDAGKDIDTKGETKLIRTGNFAFADLSGLAQGLASSEQASECFALGAFRFATGRVESTGDGCALAALEKEWVAKGRNLNALAVELVSMEQTLYRSGDTK